MGMSADAILCYGWELDPDLGLYDDDYEPRVPGHWLLREDGSVRDVDLAEQAATRLTGVSPPWELGLEDEAEKRRAREAWAAATERADAELGLETWYSGSVDGETRPVLYVKESATRADWGEAALLGQAIGPVDPGWGPRLWKAVRLLELPDPPHPPQWLLAASYG
jgi:hypothetical protein